jgi:lycopene cyclase domain-containing protein
MRGEYALVLAVSVIVPLILSFYRPLGFWRRPVRVLLAIVIPMPLFITWDVWATARGHWSFHPDRVFGITVFNLPLEELLFFVIIPFCGLFTWEVVKYYAARMKR